MRDRLLWITISPCRKSLACAFSHRLIENNATEQHFYATIAPKRQQEPRVIPGTLGISLSGTRMTAIRGSAALDGRLALQDQIIERRVKFNFVKKPVANRPAVPVGQIRSYQIKAEPERIFKDVNQHGLAPEPRSQRKLDVIPKWNVVCTTF